MPDQVKRDDPWPRPGTHCQFPVTEQIVQEIKSLYPTDPEPPAPAQAFVSNLFLSEVAESIPTTLRKMPRLSEPRPVGMRAEHWYDLGSPPGNSNLLVKVVALAKKNSASVPHSVLQWVSRLDRSHHSQSPQVDTDHFS